MRRVVSILPTSRDVLFATLPVTLLLGALLVPFYLIDLQRRFESVELRDQLALHAAGTLLEMELREVTGHLERLVEHTAAHIAKRGWNPAELEEEYRANLVAGHYQQVRFVDPQGRERIRINDMAGWPRAVPQEQLQDKSQLYYFREAIEVGEKQVYVSALDLNLEHGRVELPETPVVRFAMPVFDDDGRKLGLVVINYLAEALFRLLDPAGMLVTGQLMLVNRRGEWLARAPAERPSPDGQGILLDFSQHYPDAWRMMVAAPSGQLRESSGLMTFQRLRVPGRGAAHWTLVARVDPGIIADIRRETAGGYLRLFAVLLFPGVGLGALLVRGLKRQRGLQAALREERRWLEREVTRRTTELASANGRLQGIFDHASDAILVSDVGGRFIDVNSSACRELGYTREELLGRTVADVEIATKGTEVEALWRGVAEGTSVVRESRHRRKDGSDYPVEKTIARYREQGEWCFIAVARNISQRKRAEAELLRSHRALKTLSGANRAIAWVGNEVTLLQEVCDIVVGLGGYRFAWVGYIRPEGRVEPVGWAGYEAGYLKSIEIRRGGDGRDGGPVERAIRTGNAVVIRDIDSDPDFASHREEAARRGFRSVLALPLASKGGALGALVIYAGDVDSFDKEEAELLNEVACNLAYGITALRHRMGRRQAERALRDEHLLLEQIMDTSPSGVLVADRNGEVLFANLRGLDLLGLAKGEAGPRNLWNGEWRLADQEGRLLPAEQSPLAEVLASGMPVYDNRIWVSSNEGRRILLSVNGAPVSVDRGPIERVVFTFDDITARWQAEQERDRALADNRRLTRWLFYAREIERREIAKDLHDDLGQLLVALKTELALLLQTCQIEASAEGMTVKREFPERGRMEDLLERSDQVLERVVQRLRPVQLDMLGLRGAVEGLVDEWRRRLPGVEWRVELEGDLDGVGDEAALAVFRVLQEGVTNIAKYAQAGLVTLSLARRGKGDGEVLWLELADDGRGLIGGVDGGGVGHSSMRERVAVLGGELHIDSRAGMGVDITAIIPLNGPNGEDGEPI